MRADTHRNTQHSSQSRLLNTPHQKNLIIHATNITAPYIIGEKLQLLLMTIGVALNAE